MRHSHQKIKISYFFAWVCFVFLIRPYFLEHFLIYSNIELEVQRFPMYVLLPHPHMYVQEIEFTFFLLTGILRYNSHTTQFEVQSSVAFSIFIPLPQSILEYVHFAQKKPCTLQQSLHFPQPQVQKATNLFSVSVDLLSFSEHLI